MSEATTTPMGWKVDRAQSRNRRLLGRNSRVMVASIGMLPPTPSPMQNVRKQSASKLLGAAKLQVSRQYTPEMTVAEHESNSHETENRRDEALRRSACPSARIIPTRSECLLTVRLNAHLHDATQNVSRCRNSTGTQKQEQGWRT